MEDQLRQFVRRRAAHRCEYCHLPQSGHEERFSIDHVRAVKHGGPDTVENLAYSFLRCNLYKGPNLSGVDPESGQVVLLFNPRTEPWQFHFRWKGPLLSGLSPQGRATVHVMAMNSPERVRLRQILIVEGSLSLD